MNRTLSGFAVALVGLATGSRALGQLSNVSPDAVYSWSENIGWMDWRDAGSPAGLQGAFVGDNVMSGFVWAENVGWINLGDGAPDAGVYYANTTGTDFGVNVMPDGSLSGMAWGENIGWVNFGGGAMATPAQPARFDGVARRLRGYAWGENVGWINLDDVTHYVGVLCGADYNQDGFVTGDDFDAFSADFDAGNPAADVNHDGFVTGDDFDFFSAHFDAGC